ncbi:uncharacterized protein LOC144026688 isoform X3 [Festucalex cinctus]
MRLSMAMRGAERRPDRGGNLRQAGQGERRGGHVDVGPRSASDPDWLPGLLHHLLGMFWRAAQRHLPAQDVCVHPGAAAPPTAGGGNCGVPLHRRGDGADGASDDEKRRLLSGRPRLGERHRLCAEEVWVLRRGRLQGLVEERVLPVLRRQSQLGGLRRSLLLLRRPRQPDGAQHHVRLRHAARGAVARPTPRLPRRMFGQDRALDQTQRQDGRMPRRRSAASPDLHDVAGLGSGVLDQQSCPAQGGASEQEGAEERRRVASRLRRL